MTKPHLLKNNKGQWITTHGHCKNGHSRTYKVWDHMKQRCNNPKDKVYKHYGGRGIKVCIRWNKFENFLEDMGESPIGFSLDRINNNGSYKLSNCRWATQSQQQLNKRVSPRSTSIYNNIYLCKKTQKWCVRIRIGHKVKWVGTYDTEATAYKVQQQAQLDEKQ